jgi:hypothetical protein
VLRIATPLLLLAACTVGERPPPFLETGTGEIVVLDPTYGQAKSLTRSPSWVDSPRVQGAIAVTLLGTSGPPHLTDITAAQLDVTLQGVSAGTLTLEIFAPSGDAYDVRSAELTGTVNDTQTQRFELALAGTIADSHQLVGTWTVKALTGGAVVATASFEVLP